VRGKRAFIAPSVAGEKSNHDQPRPLRVRIAATAPLDSFEAVDTNVAQARRVDMSSSKSWFGRRGTPATKLPDLDTAHAKILQGQTPRPARERMIGRRDETYMSGAVLDT